MAMRKRGSRRIVVDGAAYRWRIRRRATLCQADYGNGTLHVGVESCPRPAKGHQIGIARAIRRAAGEHQDRFKQIGFTARVGADDNVDMRAEFKRLIIV